MALNLFLLSSVFSVLIVLNKPVQVSGAAVAPSRKADFKRVRRNLYKNIYDYIDHSVNPCADFYQHACGNWEKLNPIPDDAVDYKPIKALSYYTDLKVKEMLTSDEEPDDNDSAEVKARIVYASCVNQTARNDEGAKPLLDFLETLGGWPILSSNWSAEDFNWVKTIATMRRYGDRILIKESVNYNKKNSSFNIIYIDQPSLGLVNRADYLDSNYAFRLNAYKTYVMQVLQLLGVDKDKVNQTVHELVAFETEIARILAHPYERVNVSTFSTAISVADLQIRVPGINWSLYLNTLFEWEIPSTQMVVIKEFKYMNKLAALISRTESRMVANYIFWRFAQSKMNRLSSAFQEPLQKCFSVLLGRRTKPPQWKICVNDVSFHMREAVGAMFVRNHFSENDRDQVTAMVKNLKDVFLDIIYNTTWMSLDAKDLIKKKLDHMKYQIGYPEIISSEEEVNKVFQNVTIVPNKYFENYLKLLRHSARRKHNKLLKTDADDIWSVVSPDLTSAYYNPIKNRVIIPAGLLQEPLFSRFYTNSFNYGRMGALIGHEMTHAFDNIGRNYDFNGNINSWWNQSLIDTFNERSGCIARQYSQYRVPDSKQMLDSQGTLSENIADNGGIIAAYQAFKRLDDIETDVENESDENQIIPDESIFFYSFAQLWCGRTRPEAVLTQSRRDPHSPGVWRVIGTLQNSEDFSRVFNCSPGSFMNPMRKCRIW